MKRVSPVFLLLLSLSLVVMLQRCQQSQANPSEISYQQYLANKIAVGCGPNPYAPDDWKDVEGGIPALQGWGNFHWQVSTSNDSAQFFFDQGISMYYSFHMIEAKASFAKAATFDPDCAMAWWGLAMAYGVNYNYAMLKNAPEAMDAMTNAMAAITNETPFEKALVATLPARYNKDTLVSREQQNKAYELAIRKVHEIFPNDANAAALHADALMVQHPWDLYDIEGKPKPWTPEIVAVLEAGLTKSPNHPNLNHLYIHAVEGAADAEKGLPNAWRLSTMMPMVSHMVHMPSHIFIRTGNYREGMLVNDSSVNGFNAYVAAFPAVENDAFLYLLHNLHMKAACTMYRGSAMDANEAAMAVQQAIPTEYLQMQSGLGNYIQYIYATPIFMEVRFGRWDSLIAAKEINPSLKYVWMAQAFGKGIAFAKKGNLNEAERLLQKMQQQKNDPLFKEKFETINPAEKGIAIMILLLQGNIALAKNELNSAEEYFADAVKQEDTFWYGEPRDWLLPTRHYLADVLSRQNKLTAAEQVYKMELVINPKNVWSLYGLAEAQKKLGKKNAWQQTKSAFNMASKGSDIQIKSSVM
jgi:tetratricopeptide (TPR) repeat protein